MEDYGFKLYNAIAEGEIKFLKGYYHPAEMLWKDLDGKAIPKWTSNMETISAAKEHFGDRASYAELRYVMAHIRGKSE